MILNLLTTLSLYFLPLFSLYVYGTESVKSINSIAGPHHDIGISSSLVGMIIPFFSLFIFRSRMR